MHSRQAGWWNTSLNPCRRRCSSHLVSILKTLANSTPSRSSGLFPLPSLSHKYNKENQNANKHYHNQASLHYVYDGMIFFYSSQRQKGMNEEKITMHSCSKNDQEERIVLDILGAPDMQLNN